jgi:hypothetical protein
MSHYRLIQNIDKDPSLPADEKRHLIDTLYYRAIELGQAAKAAMTRIDESSFGERGGSSIFGRRRSHAAGTGAPKRGCCRGILSGGVGRDRQAGRARLA